MRILKREGTNNNHEHSLMKHMLHMILCCGIPLVIIFALPLVASINPGFAGVLGIIAPFICPVMMIGMMIMMFRKDKPGCCEQKTVEAKELSEK